MGSPREEQNREPRGSPFSSVGDPLAYWAVVPPAAPPAPGGGATRGHALARGGDRRPRQTGLQLHLAGALAKLLPIQHQVAQLLPPILPFLAELRAVRLDRPLVGAALQVVAELLAVPAQVARVPRVVPDVPIHGV